VEVLLAATASKHGRDLAGGGAGAAERSQESHLNERFQDFCSGCDLRKGTASTLVPTMERFFQRLQCPHERPLAINRSMTVALHAPRRPKPRRLIGHQPAFDAPSLLFWLAFKGPERSGHLTWPALYSPALFGFEFSIFSAHAAELPELTPAFPDQQPLFHLRPQAILVIVHECGLAPWSEAGCAGENAVNILLKKSDCFCTCRNGLLVSFGYSIHVRQPP